MRFLLAGLIACLSLAVAEAGESISERAGYFYQQRPRLGHFKDYPFTDLYKTYATAFVLPNFPDRPLDDYRNYLPSGDECMVFFRKFRINEYKLVDIDEFIVLDACLGYLYESTFHEEDKEASQYVRDNLQQFIDDEKLREFYTNTKLDSLPDQAKECVGNLFLQAVEAKHQFRDVLCNNHWLEIFTRFAECQVQIPRECRATDTYLSALYERVRARANECFDNEIHELNKSIRHHYVKSPLQRVENSLTSKLSKPAKQRRVRFWTKQMTEVLRAVQGTDKEINLRTVNEIIRGVGQKVPQIIDRLSINLARYADSKISLSKKELAKDPSGVLSYDSLLDRMCNFFRTSDNENYYDYTTPFVRMVRMLKYEEIFGITQNYFITHVLNQSYETAPLYLSVCSCNLLSFTEGAFGALPNNSPNRYVVKFKKDTSDMVQWPDAGFY